MTRSKIEFATILATMRGQDEDPKQLAQDMSLRKLCYEIEKLEQEAETLKESAPEGPQAETTAAPSEKTEPQKKPPRQKHILSWLLDSSSEDES
jgi:hypothetical protein